MLLGKGRVFGCALFYFIHKILNSPGLLAFRQAYFTGISFVIGKVYQGECRSIGYASFGSCDCLGGSNTSFERSGTDTEATAL
jgi:hypothetical protein